MDGGGVVVGGLSCWSFCCGCCCRWSCVGVWRSICMPTAAKRRARRDARRGRNNLLFAFCGSRSLPFQFSQGTGGRWKGGLVGWWKMGADLGPRDRANPVTKWTTFCQPCNWELPRCVCGCLDILSAAAVETRARIQIDLECSTHGKWQMFGIPIQESFFCFSGRLSKREDLLISLGQGNLRAVPKRLTAWKVLRRAKKLETRNRRAPHVISHKTHLNVALIRQKKMIMSSSLTKYKSKGFFDR